MAVHLGADAEMMIRYKDCPEPLPPGMDSEDNVEKVMHATFRIGESKVSHGVGLFSRARQHWRELESLGLEKIKGGDAN